MNFDLDIDNYTKDDYLDIFELDKNMNPSKHSVKKNYEKLLNNIEEENLDIEKKNKIKLFLTECKNNLLEIIKTDKVNYKLIDSDFIPNLEDSETFETNSHFVAHSLPGTVSNQITSDICNRG